MKRCFLYVFLLLLLLGGTGQQSLNGTYHGISVNAATSGDVLIWASDLTHVQDGGVPANTAGASAVAYEYLPATGTNTGFPAGNAILCGGMVSPTSFASSNVWLGVTTRDTLSTNFYDVCIYNSNGSSLLADLGSGTQGTTITNTPTVQNFAWRQGTVRFTAGAAYHVCWTGSAVTAHLYTAAQVFDLTTATTSSNGQCPSNVTFSAAYAAQAVPGLRFMP